MRIYVTLCILVSSLFSNAQLIEGDILFIAFNADGTDGFSITVFNDIPPNSTIYFSDNEWNELDIGSGGAFTATTEGEMTWNSGPTAIIRGEVVNFTGTASTANANYGASIGTIAGVINLNGNDEVLYAYLGTDNVTPTRFLTAIANNNFTSINGPIAGTNLSVISSASEFTGNNDVIIYTGGTVCNTTVANCKSLILDNTNWSVEDGAGDQSTNTIIPDFITNVPLAFTGTALPIELLSFKLEYLNREELNVNWTLASEKDDIAYYEIEYKQENTNWVALGFVESKGQSSNTVLYEVKLKNKFNKQSYFRIKQVNINNKANYSDIVRYTFNEQLSISPNPSNGNFNIFSKNNLIRTELVLYNSLGNTVPLPPVSIKNKHEIILHGEILKKGIYTLAINQKNYRIVKL